MPDRMKIPLSVMGVLAILVSYADIFYKYDSGVGFYVLGIGFVSYRARIMSSLLTLGIFFSKQTLSMIRHRKRAVVISITPKIVWLRDK